MNIREQRNGGSIHGVKNSTEWAKSIKYSSILYNLSNTDDTRALTEHLWEKKARQQNKSGREEQEDKVKMGSYLSRRPPLYLSQEERVLYHRETTSVMCTRASVPSLTGGGTKIREALQVNFSTNLGRAQRKWKWMSQHCETPDRNTVMGLGKILSFSVSKLN